MVLKCYCRLVLDCGLDFVVLALHELCRLDNLDELTDQLHQLLTLMAGTDKLAQCERAAITQLADSAVMSRLRDAGNRYILLPLFQRCWQGFPR